MSIVKSLLVQYTSVVLMSIGTRKKNIPRRRNACTQLIVLGMQKSPARLLTLAKDQPTSLAGIGAKDCNEILDAEDDRQ